MLLLTCAQRARSSRMPLERLKLPIQHAAESATAGAKTTAMVGIAYAAVLPLIVLQVSALLQCVVEALGS